MIGFEGCSDQQPERVLLDSGTELDASVRTALKRGHFQKYQYGDCMPASYFATLLGLHLGTGTKTVLVLNDAGKDRLCALLQVSAAGVHASDSL